MAISNEVRSPQIFSLWVVHRIESLKGSILFLFSNSEKLSFSIFKNIYISAGTVDNTDGADIRPNKWQSAMKSEAHKSLVCG